MVRSAASRFDEPLLPWHIWLGLPLVVLYTTRWFLPFTNAIANLPDVVHTVLQVGTYAFGLAIAGMSLPYALRRGWSLWRMALIAFVLVFVANVLWSSFLQPMAESISGTVAQESLNTADFEEKFHEAPWRWGFLMVVIGPITEEVLYRFVLFRSLATRSLVAAHAITAAAFGVFHIVEAVFADHQTDQWLTIGGYMLFSLVLTWVYRRYGNLWPCIIAHGLYNFLGVLTFVF